MPQVWARGWPPCACTRSAHWPKRASSAALAAAFDGSSCTAFLRCVSALSRSSPHAYTTPAT